MWVKVVCVDMVNYEEVSLKGAGDVILLLTHSFYVANLIVSRRSDPTRPISSFDFHDWPYCIIPLWLLS